MMNKHPLEGMLEPVVDGMGYELVRVLTIGAKNPTLQVMIDRKDGKEVTVDDCAAVSRRLSDVLDEKDPIESQYSLEVSSPGIDRPLTKPEHFARFSGYEAKIETSTVIEGRKRFKGRISGIDDKNNIAFEMDGTEYVIPFDEVAKAKILITDELLQKYAEIQAEE